MSSFNSPVNDAFAILIHGMEKTQKSPTSETVNQADQLHQDNDDNKSCDCST